jgi:hypothetical protein
MTESFSKNFIDYEEYPQSADIQNRCVSMIGRLFNAPVNEEGAAAVGTSTVGSSEAIMLAVLAMKKRWQNARKAAGKPFDKPNIVMSSAVQVCWEKAARYFEVSLDLGELPRFDADKERSRKNMSIVPRTDMSLTLKRRSTWWMRIPLVFASFLERPIPENTKMRRPSMIY